MTENLFFELKTEKILDILKNVGVFTNIKQLGERGSRDRAANTSGTGDPGERQLYVVGPNTYGSD